MMSIRTPLWAALIALLMFSPTVTTAQNKGKGKGQPKRNTPEPPATDPATMKIAKGFKVELLYSVPKNEQGSWVSMCVDPKGRLIVSDQYGGLYRVTPPPIGQTDGTKIEKIPAKIGLAQGLLWAFDSLYVVVNAGGKGNSSGCTASRRRRRMTHSTRSNCCARSRAAAANTARTRFS